MNKINRPTVKKQARELIKGKVFQLFLIIFIVGLLTGGGSGLSLNFNINDNDFNLFNKNNGYSDDYGFNDDFASDYFGYYGDEEDYDFDYDDYDFDEDFDFDEFYENQHNDADNPIEGFGDNISGAVSQLGAVSADEIIGGSNKTTSMFVGRSIIFMAILAVLSGIVTLIFTPLEVTLSGILVSFIRRNPAESFDLGKQLGAVFKNSFNKTFWKKLGLVLLRGLITGLLALLFIVPGIMYYYSTYFANQLMCDNPDLSPSEALELSKRMTKGHRGELFVLNLSFIPWLLLTLVTLGIASIYVTPYVQVTDALFYENFRIRAIQNGVISQQEVTARENMGAQSENNYFNGGANGNAYSDPYSAPYSNGYNAQSYNSANDYSSQQGSYYTPQQSDFNTTQTGEYYQPPADNNNTEN